MPAAGYRAACCALALSRWMLEAWPRQYGRNLLNQLTQSAFASGGLCRIRARIQPGAQITHPDSQGCC